jgi:hypothetical protein
MHDNETTERHARVRFFWVGLGTDEVSQRRVWRYALGTAHSQLEAQKLVIANITRLGHGRAALPGHEDDPAAIYEFGTDSSIGNNAFQVYAIAQRKLHDECPWLVPMPIGSGMGVLYASGFEPTFDEMAQMRRNAGL